ncbi:hypothetical protein AMST5_04085 [freshwater sediment metagenome]|uniref:Helix-turn-helix domain-containing protein n=1 Tax=freshwater sediment metagenome TaxID=556182 RepID=A0AA48M6E0_9ZZZZ
MTRDDLLSALASARATVAALEGALAAMDGAPMRAPAASAPLAPDEWIDTARAARIARVEYSTLYRWGHKFPGLAEKTQSGQWRFRRSMILSIASVPASERGDNGEDGDAPLLQLAMAGDHSREEKQPLAEETR